MRKVTTVVVGAGHCGLAMSHCLTGHGIDHVVLERGEVANSWRTERWDSLRLLTPNWQSRLPGRGDDNADPDGFRTMPQVVDLISRYATAIPAPVRSWTRVNSITASDEGYLVTTDQGDWQGRTVVLASGACNVPIVPKLAQAVPASIAMLTPTRYRKPDQLDPGGVLVVGASATGIQLAREIHLSGRPVTLAVGEHVRVPRTYRGRDIMWWLDRAGVLNQRYDEVDDIARARRVPSFQLVGSDTPETLDLNALRALGVGLVGRIVGISGQTLQFSGALANLCALSDLKMGRLLDGIDRWATVNGLDGTVEPPSRPEPTLVEQRPRLSLDLGRGTIRTILWATGYRPDHSWLKMPVLDRKGQLLHDGGVTPAPGLYVMGLPFQRRRKSTLIDGAGDDARELSELLAAYLDGRRMARVQPDGWPSAA